MPQFIRTTALAESEKAEWTFFVTGNKNIRFETARRCVFLKDGRCPVKEYPDGALMEFLFLQFAADKSDIRTLSKWIDNACLD